MGQKAGWDQDWAVGPPCDLLEVRDALKLLSLCSVRGICPCRSWGRVSQQSVSLPQDTLSQCPVLPDMEPPWHQAPSSAQLLLCPGHQSGTHRSGEAVLVSPGVPAGSSLVC